MVLPLIGFSQPNINIDVTSISEVLNVDSTVTKVVTIENTGDKTLTWSIELRTGDTVSFSKQSNVEYSLPEN